MAQSKLNFLTAGEGEGTPVLLVHGYTGDSQSWRLVAPLLAEGRRVYSIDLPCHGTSPVTAPESFSHFVEMIADALSAEGLDRFHLVGHSLGGAVAFALSEVLAGKVQSLTAVAPAGLAPEVDGWFIEEYVTATAPEEIKVWLQRIVGRSFMLPDGLAELIAEKRTDPERIQAQLAIGRLFFPAGVQNIDVTEQMNKVSVPAKIIWGKQDSLIPWQHALTAPPQIGLHFLAEVGHMPPLEAPQAINNIIGEAIATAEV
ncbi:MAG: alpha/beta fold hydrolase [Pseudomonadota bacterium]